MCNLMAKCITYFTMLVEVLIIKNVKAVGVMLSAWNLLYAHAQMCDEAFIKEKKLIYSIFIPTACCTVGVGRNRKEE